MYSIKDISERFNVTYRTIRYYEEGVGLTINRDKSGIAYYKQNRQKEERLSYEREQNKGLLVTPGKVVRRLVSRLQRQRQEDGQKGRQEDSR